MVLIFSGCVATLKDYNAQSPDEQEIKTILIKWQDSWNNKENEGVLSVIHKNAKIMIGEERKIVSKKEYGDLIPSRRREVGKVTYGEPIIKSGVCT